MGSDKSNQGSAAAKQGEADAKDNNYSPPAGPSWTTCALDQHEADRQTQAVTDYKTSYHQAGGK